MPAEQETTCCSQEWIECHPQPESLQTPIAQKPVRESKEPHLLKVMKQDCSGVSGMPDILFTSSIDVLNDFRRRNDAAAVPITRPTPRPMSKSQLKVCRSLLQS